MRRCVVLVLLAVCAMVWTTVAIPLCDYRSPKTDLSDLTLNFTYQYRNDPYGLETRDISQGQFGVDYVQLFDTPQYGFDLAFENTLMVTAEGLSTYGIQADGNYKRYFSSEQDSFAYSGASLRSSSSFQKLGLSFNLGVGVGRFTDVTPLAKATRINDYLVSRGSLTDQLHAVDLQILALEIGSAASYESRAALLAVIQEIIETSGSVRLGGLDALDISEITRFIQEEGFSRYCGWDLKLGLGYELLDPSGGDNDLLFSGGFDYALATAPKAQFLLQGSFSGPPDILTTHRADFTGSYDYFISSFLSANATYNWSRETWSGVNTDTHRVSLEFALSPVDTASVVAGVFLEHRPYYLEWSIDVQLSIQMDLL
ncbi:MAG: hypothetical protein E4H08_06770 [Candidatus Atribacteria bacterium]|jgi:hypothetical protein|nr:MAG: hypothetical protein E4H08_06770 [Candidatus Atribacteria bacterium]